MSNNDLRKIQQHIKQPYRYVAEYFVLYENGTYQKDSIDLTRDEYVSDNKWIEELILGRISNNEIYRVKFERKYKCLR